MNWKKAKYILPGIYLLVLVILFILNKIFPPDCGLFGCWSILVLLIGALTIPVNTIFYPFFAILKLSFNPFVSGTITATIILFFIGYSIDKVREMKK